MVVGVLFQADYCWFKARGAEIVFTKYSKNFQHLTAPKTAIILTIAFCLLSNEWSNALRSLTCIFSTFANRWTWVTRSSDGILLRFLAYRLRNIFWSFGWSTPLKCCTAVQWALRRLLTMRDIMMPSISALFSNRCIKRHRLNTAKIKPVRKFINFVIKI